MHTFVHIPCSHLQTEPLEKNLHYFEKKMQVKLKETSYLLEYIFLITLV